MRVLLLQKGVFHAVHERLEAGFDDVVVDADRAPFLAVGGLDQTRVRARCR
jgi:hypothetical protein